LTLSGFRATQPKPLRYMQPKTRPEIYFPPLLQCAWEEILNEPTLPLYITEGELKSACACSLGLPTIGLGGVYNWMSKKYEFAFHPDLEDITWKGREVTLLFDSDAATNPDVVKAQNLLAKELLNRGAKPRIASLPHGKADSNGKRAKQGLDDFLVSQGVEALKRVINDAPEFMESHALWDMNAELVYILKPGLVIRRTDGHQMSPGQFIQHAYANRHYYEVKQTRNGPAMVRQKLAPRWLEWEHRFELEKITYAPGQAQIIEGAWNTWGGWGVEPEEGSVEPWTRLLEYLFKTESAEVRDWFERWAAYPLQHPGTKLFTAVVLWGVAQGTGKTLLGYTLRDIYGRNAIEIKDKQLKGHFNDWADNKQFIIGDEVTGSDKRQDADRMKGLITQENILIEKKFLPTYTLPDCVNYYFTSQHPDAFFLEDNDRRYMVTEVPGPPMPEQFYKDYEQWWKRENGAAKLFNHLLKLDLKGFNPKARAPHTRAKEAMIYDSKSDIGVWCHGLRESPETILRAGYNEQTAARCDLFTAAELLHAYDPNRDRKSGLTVNGLGRALKQAGFRQILAGAQVWTSHGPKRFYAVRNFDKWDRASQDEVRTHYLTYFGSVK
jgi:hypothetical protein